MTLFATLLGLAGCALMLLGTETEFAGDAADGARRVLVRRAGVAMALIGLLLRAWADFA